MISQSLLQILVIKYPRFAWKILEFLHIVKPVPGNVYQSHVLENLRDMHVVRLQISSLFVWKIFFDLVKYWQNKRKKKFFAKSYSRFSAGFSARENMLKWFSIIFSIIFFYYFFLLFFSYLLEWKLNPGGNLFLLARSCVFSTREFYYFFYILNFVLLDSILSQSIN